MYDVFDFYTSQSPKDSERLRRANESASLPPIERSYIDSTTPFPKDPSRFWQSIENKNLLQKFLYDCRKKGEKDTYNVVLLGKEGRKRYIYCCTTREGREKKIHIMLYY